MCVLDSQTVFWGKPSCECIMKLDVWVLVILSTILGFLFFGSLIWILIKIVRKFLKNNNDNNEPNSLPQNEAISNQPLMEVSVQKITLLYIINIALPQKLIIFYEVHIKNYSKINLFLGI